LTGRWLGFEDADIIINATDGTFESRPLVPAPTISRSPRVGFTGRLHQIQYRLDHGRRREHLTVISVALTVDAVRVDFQRYGDAVRRMRSAMRAAPWWTRAASWIALWRFVLVSCSAAAPLPGSVIATA
jgi:hypothetical protein